MQRIAATATGKETVTHRLIGNLKLSLRYYVVASIQVYTTQAAQDCSDASSWGCTRIQPLKALICAQACYSRRCGGGYWWADGMYD